MNTAELRQLALRAQRALDWTSAADLWDRAIAAYPDPRGALAQRDIALMAERRESCRYMARKEAS